MPVEVAVNIKSVTLVDAILDGEIRQSLPRSRLGRKTSRRWPGVRVNLESPQSSNVSSCLFEGKP
jgi:hypothetical protein